MALQIREAASIGDIFTLQEIAEQLPPNSIHHKNIQSMIDAFDFAAMESLADEIESGAH